MRVSGFSKSRSWYTETMVAITCHRNAVSVRREIFSNWIAECNVTERYVTNSKDHRPLASDFNKVLTLKAKAKTDRGLDAEFKQGLQFCIYRQFNKIIPDSLVAQIVLSSCCGNRQRNQQIQIRQAYFFTHQLYLPRELRWKFALIKCNHILSRRMKEDFIFSPRSSFGTHGVTGRFTNHSSSLTLDHFNWFSPSEIWIRWINW